MIYLFYHIACDFFSNMMMSQEKSKSMPMQILLFFWGGGGAGEEEVYYGICASRESKSETQLTMQNTIAFVCRHGEMTGVDT